MKILVILSLILCFLFSGCDVHSSKCLIKSLEFSDVDSIEIKYLVLNRSQKKEAGKSLWFLKAQDSLSHTIYFEKDELDINKNNISNFFDSLSNYVKYSSYHPEDRFYRTADTTYMKVRFFLKGDVTMYLEYGEYMRFNSIGFYGDSFWMKFGGGKAFYIGYASPLHFEAPHLKPYFQEFLNKMIQYKRNKLIQNNKLNADTLKIENELPFWIDD